MINQQTFRKWLRRTALTTLTVCLTACTPTQSTHAQGQNMNEALEFYIGQNGEVLTSSDKKSTAMVDKQPAGIAFYKMNWPQQNKLLRFKHGQYSFDLPNVSRMMGSHDLVFPNEHIQYFNVTFNLTNPTAISHQEARDRLYAFFKDLQAKGWKRYIYRGSERFKGKAAWNDGWTDLNYIPTIDEWMDWKNQPYYMLYADGVILTFRPERDPQKMDINQLGDYFVDLDIESLRGDLRSMSGYGEWPEQKQRTYDWRIELPAALEKAKQHRIDSEKAARAKGLEIDETYQDPPIPKEFLVDPATQVEYGAKPTVQGGQPCPITGMWQCQYPGGGEQTLFMRKGDFMPNPKVDTTGQNGLVWTLLNPVNDV